jgi:hypothetical protein
VTVSGTTSSFTLSQASRVTFTITQNVPGRKSHKTCVAPTSHNRQEPSCQRTVTVTTFTVLGHAGRNHLSFKTLLVHGRPLTPGHYVVTITTADPPGGTPAPPRHFAFTIVN